MMVVASLILILVAIIFFLMGMLIFVSGKKKGGRHEVLSSEVSVEQVGVDDSADDGLGGSEPENGNGLASEDCIEDGSGHHMVPDIIDTTPCVEGGIDIDFWEMVENFDSLDVDTRQLVATRLAAAGFFRKEKASDLIMANLPYGGFDGDNQSGDSETDEDSDGEVDRPSANVPPSLNGILTTKPEEKPDNNSKNNDSEDDNGFPDPTEVPSCNIAEEFPEEDEERRRLVEEFDN